MRKIIIAAVASNGVIGNKNKMPWKLKEEMSFFKETTTGNAVLMGNNTFKSIGRPLKKRMNLVLSKHEKNSRITDNLFFFDSIEKATNFAYDSDIENFFIIGGGEVFSQTVNSVDELMISRIPGEIKGDSYFPKIDNKIWKLVATENYPTFAVEKYLRKQTDE